MPGERLSMRKIREVLRLRLGQGLSQRAIGQSLRLSQGAVQRTSTGHAVRDWGGRCPTGSTTCSLRRCCFRRRRTWRPDQRPVPDWSVVHRELRRPNMTLALLWEEYRGGPAARTGLATPGSAICTANGLAG